MNEFEKVGYETGPKQETRGSVQGTDEALRQAKIRLLEAKAALIAAQMDRLIDGPEKADHLRTEPSGQTGGAVDRLDIEIRDTGKGPEVRAWYGQQPDTCFSPVFGHGDLMRTVQAMIREWLDKTNNCRRP